MQSQEKYELVMTLWDFSYFAKTTIWSQYTFVLRRCGLRLFIRMTFIQADIKCH